jgi:hypothetical protein
VSINGMWCSEAANTTTSNRWCSSPPKRRCSIRTPAVCAKRRRDRRGGRVRFDADHVREHVAQLFEKVAGAAADV